MSGFAGRGPAVGVHDELYATALVLEAGDAKAAVVSADLLFVGECFTAKVREEVEHRTGIPGTSVFLCATHTHYGPTTLGFEKGEEAAPDEAAYLTNLVHLLAGAIQEAASKVEPVRIGVGRGDSDVGINRRERRPDGSIILGQNSAGPVDREVIVVRLDGADGKPLAALVNFATHAVCQGGSMRTLSADFIGPMRNLVESAAGARCLFLQGACADINPVLMEASFEPARKSGVLLGGKVVKVFEAIATEEASGVASISAEVGLPAKTFGSETETREAIDSLEEDLRKLQEEGAAPGRIRWCQKRLDRARQALECILRDEALPPVASEVAALRLGDVVLLMAPGEVFNEIGTEIKTRAPLADTLFVGYSNGSIGYVPTPDAYSEGGYEVDRACRVAPEASGMLIEEAVRQLGELA